VQGAVIYGIEKNLHKSLKIPAPAAATEDSSDETVTTEHEGTTIQGTDGVAQSTLPTTVSGETGDSKREVEDAMSTFTDDQSLGLPETQKTSLIKEIADQVWKSTTASLELREDDLIRISAALPNLLKELSLELSLSANTIIEKQAIAFLRRYRG
jgi:hypothetical protein